MMQLFKNLEINLSIAEALENENITVPTIIQQKVIPEAMKNKDLIVQSETGTGKTLAYLIPLFQKLDYTKKEMQAIIIAPTHELAIQIQRQIELLSNNSEIKLTSTPIIGNVNIDRQIDKLKQRPNIIVGSAGRILELIKKKRIITHNIKTIILDEADSLMDEHNLQSVDSIIKSTLKERQLMMFSASISKKTHEYAKKIMKEPDFIIGDEEISIPTTIEHLYFITEQRDKFEVLRKLIRMVNPKKAIAFVNKTEDIDMFTSKLKYHGFKAENIQGKNIKLDRKKVMEDFRNGKIQILVASDIAARGIDIEDITHIFNLSMPEDPKNYLHRVGRTGRNGNAGVAISIITARELELIKLYQKELKISITEKDMFKGEMISPKSTSQKSNYDKVPREKEIKHYERSTKTFSETFKNKKEYNPKATKRSGRK